MEEPDILRRYTSLPSLIHILITKKITLLSPETWDDKNDVHYLNVYKNKKQLSTLLALCFTETNETYHHWKVFSHGSGGVRIDFSKGNLLGYFASKEYKCGNVEYGLVKEQKERAEQGGLQIDDLPFTKRWSYADEKEFRIIYESQDESQEEIGVDIDLNKCIKEIVLSPWLHGSLFENVNTLLKGIEGCDRLTINRSTITSHEKWKGYADQAVK